MNTDTIMQAIQRGEISRAAAARALNVSERTINRLMQKHGVRRPERPKGKYRAAHEAAIAKREKQRRIVCAIHNWHDVPKAAKKLGMSERQVYRLIKKYKEAA